MLFSIKPDIICPGATVISANSNGNSGSSCGFVGKSGETKVLILNFIKIINCSGTSMASPCCAGAAALIRQYFAVDAYWKKVCNPLYPNCASMSISGVLVKAIVLHSGTAMIKKHGISTTLDHILTSPPDTIQVISWCTASASINWGLLL